MTTPPIATAPPSDFRRHVRNISQQSSVFLIGTLFTTAAGYFFKVYLARVLGAEALGIYALDGQLGRLTGYLPRLLALTPADLANTAEHYLESLPLSSAVVEG